MQIQPQSLRRLRAGSIADLRGGERYAVVNRILPYTREEDRGIELDVMVPIRSDQDIVTARQHGRKLALRLGLTSMDAVLVASAISELARNVLQYAGTGNVRLTRIERSGQVGLAVVVRDEGPGIADIAEALQNGFSTSGSLGLGLPGVKRLMDEFDIESELRRGTTVSVRKWKR